MMAPQANPWIPMLGASTSAPKMIPKLRTIGAMAGRMKCWCDCSIEVMMLLIGVTAVFFVALNSYGKNLASPISELARASRSTRDRSRSGSLSPRTGMSLSATERRSIRSSAS